MRPGFRVRFVLWFAGLSALLVGCVVGASILSLCRKSERKLRADDAASCFLLASMVEEEIDEAGDAALAKGEIEAKLSAVGHPVRIWINGSSLVDRPTSDLDRLPASLEVMERARREQGTFWTGPSGGDYFLHVVPITALGGAVHGEIMTSRPAPLRTQIRQALVEGALAWAAALLLCIFLGRLAAGSAMRPVRALTRIAEGLHAGNLSVRASVSKEDPELAHLEEAFNGMLDRIGQAFTRLESYSADAAHEVQSPVAVMRGNLEVAIREGTWTARQRELLGSLLEEVERIQGVCQDMLYLAKTEGEMGKASFQEVSLNEVAREAQEIGELLGSARAIRVHLQGDATPCRVLGDRIRLLRALTNLVDNAVKYGRDGGNVWIWLVLAPESCKVVVQDDGVGIPFEALPHLFERFYKVDPTRGRSVRGSGLGLAVTRAIVHAHGGTIGIASSPGVGTMATVTLPAAPRRDALPAPQEASPQEALPPPAQSGAPAAPALP